MGQIQMFSVDNTHYQVMMYQEGDRWSLSFTGREGGLARTTLRVEKYTEEEAIERGMEWFAWWLGQR